MQLRRACELLQAAYRSGDAVEFYRAVAFIEQALAATPEPEIEAGRFIVDHEYADEWRLWDRERFVVGMSAHELHQLSATVMAADLRRQGI